MINCHILLSMVYTEETFEGCKIHSFRSKLAEHVILILGNHQQQQWHKETMISKNKPQKSFQICILQNIRKSFHAYNIYG